MIKTTVVNLGEFTHKMGEKYPQAVKAGTSEGIRAAATALADDVAANTPVKSGKAQAFVYDKMIGPLKGRVGYDPKNSFYMRFVEFGTKRHPIYAKGRRGSKATKRLTAGFRRHAPSYQTWAWDEGGVGNAMEQHFGAEWGQISGRTKQKKALTVGGRFFTKVMHPGIRPRLTLQKRLDASREKITSTIRAAIFVQIDGARG